MKKNGEVESVWMLTNEQYTQLLNFAVNHLLAVGSVTVQDIDEDNLEEEAGEEEYDAMKELLEAAKKEEMYQA